MPYAQMLRELFPEISLEAEDLLLLERFQIKSLPDRVAAGEFAILINEYPVLGRFLVNKYPPIAPFLEGLLKEHVLVRDRDQIMELCQEALWEIADLIIYNKHPEAYDRNSAISWDISEITSITSLEGKTVADIGAGSGRISFMLAPFAKIVYAVEPLESFRNFMKERVLRQKLENLFVMDGRLDSIPLPDDSLDVLITSNAIGWDIGAELKEIERVVKPGGSAIHLLHMDSKNENPYHKILTSSSWKYQHLRSSTGEKVKIRYFKK